MKIENDRQAVGFIMEAALEQAEQDELDITVTRFDEAGVMTGNNGFVLRVGHPGGPEYQVTFVRSR